MFGLISIKENKDSSKDSSSKKVVKICLLFGNKVLLIEKKFFL